MHFVKFVAVVAVMAGAGCEPRAINASSDSLANRLEVGMTPGQVLGIIGASQFESRMPGDVTTVCRSYIYDEALNVKFVHVRFENGKVVSASDRHRKVCELP